MEITLLIALAVNWLFLNPYYQGLLTWAKPINRKPFTCLYCLTFWIALIALTIAGGNTILMILLQASAASYLAVFLEKVFKSFPTKI